MLTIYKYPMLSDKYFSLDMPTKAEILSVQEQNGEPQIWALVDPKKQMETRNFANFETGAKIAEKKSTALYWNISRLKI